MRVRERGSENRGEKRGREGEENKSKQVSELGRGRAEEGEGSVRERRSEWEACSPRIPTSPGGGAGGKSEREHSMRGGDARRGGHGEGAQDAPGKESGLMLMPGPYA